MPFLYLSSRIRKLIIPTYNLMYVPHFSGEFRHVDTQSLRLGVQETTVKTGIVGHNIGVFESREHVPNDVFEEGGADNFTRRDPVDVGSANVPFRVHESGIGVEYASR